MDDTFIMTFYRRETPNDHPFSDNFTFGEWACKCGRCDRQPLHNLIIPKLEELRMALGGRPMTITSGFRCAPHNRSIGGASKSRHMVGDAADIKVRDRRPADVALAAKDVGFTGIKVYPSWTHVDLRPGTPWYAGIPA